jgi:diaminopimelate epimerase
VVTINRIQRASDGFKYGAPDDHELGVQYVADYLHRHNFQLEIPFNQFYSPDFKAVNRGCSEGWSYDLAAWLYIKDGGPHMIVEVDGKKHDKKQHKIQDGIAQKWIEETYPNCYFVRIQKEDAKYDHWLKRKLAV